MNQVRGIMTCVFCAIGKFQGKIFKHEVENNMEVEENLFLNAVT